jgi:Cell wall-active antibiotics response 4TMS YvqF
VTRSRRGTLIGATWLIGLGLVFLVREAYGWSWNEAWPLFVILVGVATFISTLLDRRPGLAGIWSFTWPVIWIAVGVLLLLSTTGQLESGPAEIIDTYWPWAAVGLGIWLLIGAFVPIGGRATEQLSIPLSGTTPAAVAIRFGAGDLTARPAATGMLVDGWFEGGVRSSRTGPNGIELRQDTDHGLPWVDHGSRWEVGLTGEVPLDLRLDTGASKARLDLRDVQLRSLDLHTGASDTTVFLPRAAGATDVRVQAGAASLSIEVPSGVAARIRSTSVLGSSQVDQNRFPRVGDAYESPDYATATNRADISISSGVGSVKVVGGD